MFGQHIPEEIKDTLLKMGICCSKAAGGNDECIEGTEVETKHGESLRQFLSIQIDSGKIDGNSTALVDDYEMCSYTFSQLDTEIHFMAQRLQKALDYQPSINFNEDGDTVIMFSMGNCDKMIFLLFAILELNLTYCAIDPTTTEDRLLNIIRCLKPVLIIIDSYPAIISRFACSAHIVRIITIKELLEDQYEGVFNIPEVIKKFGKQSNVYKKSIAPTAGIYFSSGTTSSGKGARISHQSIFNRIEWQWKTVPYDKNDIVPLLTLPTNHTSVADIYAPLLQGVPLLIYYLVYPPTPEFLLNIISEKLITRLTVSSNVLEHLLETIERSEDQLTLERKLYSVKVWFSNGDALTYELVEQFFQLLGNTNREQLQEVPTERIGDSNTNVIEKVSENIGKPNNSKVKLVHLYGTTETTADAVYEIFEDLKDLKKKSYKQCVPLGIPIWNTKIYIEENDAFNILSFDNTGEISVSGACLALGYTTGVKAKDFERNTREDYYGKYGRLHRTKDLGQILACNDGVMRLFYKGRCSQIIKIKGQKINLADIGATIKETNLVENVEVVVFHSDNEEDDILVAAVELKVDVSPDMLLDSLTGVINDDIMPEIYPVVEMPLLPDGRLDYHALYNEYVTNRRMVRTKDWYALHIAHYKMDAAKTLCEAVAISIGSSIRNVIDQFYSSFASIGGNSNNTVICLQRIRERDYRITLEQFIQSKTLCEIMEKMVKAAEKPPSELLDSIDMSNCSLPRDQYETLSLANEQKDDVIQVISESYPMKNELIICIKADPGDFKAILNDIWPIFIKQKLSIVVKDLSTDKICGCFLIHDKTLKPKVKKIPKPLKYYFELMEYVERKTKRKNHIKGKVILPLFVAVDKSVTLFDSVLIVKNLLVTALQKATSAGFDEMHVITSQPLIKHLCKYMLKATVSLEYQVEHFIASDNTKPYQYAGSYRKITCLTKSLQFDSQTSKKSNKNKFESKQKRIFPPIAHIPPKHKNSPIVIIESDEEIPDYFM